MQQNGIGQKLIIQADGGSRGNPGPAGFGAVVMSANGAVLCEVAGFLGTATNNFAEYRGAIAGLDAALSLDPQAPVELQMDSKLVVQQLKGEWQVKEPTLRELAKQALQLISGRQVEFKWIPRAENKLADALANEAMDTRSPRICRDKTSAASLTEPPLAAQGRIRFASTGDTDATVAPKPTISSLSHLGAEGFLPQLTLVLVRHGVTDMTVTHRFSGSGTAGPHLNAAGKVQAAQAADAIYRIGRDTWPAVTKPTSAIFASPMNRTQDTAAAIGRRLGLPVTVQENLREVHFGEWEGLTGPEINEKYPGELLAWQAGKRNPPGGESLADVRARLRAFLSEHALRYANSGPTVPTTHVLVSHAVAIKSAVGELLELPVHTSARIWPTPASVTIMQLRVAPGGELAEAHLLGLGVPTGR